MATRIGVDVGGTFTDLIFLDEETGEVSVGKGPSRPAAVDEAVRRRDRGRAGRARRGDAPSTSCTERRSASTHCSSARARASAC